MKIEKKAQSGRDRNNSYKMKENYERTGYEFIEGINSVSMLLDNNKGRRKIFDLYILQSRENDLKIKNILQNAHEKHLNVSILSKDAFEKSLNINSLKSQGICARVSNYSYPDIDTFLAGNLNRKSRFLILDGVTDVGNFGGIIRSVFAFDFDGIIIPRHKSADVNKDVNRASSGALEGVNIFRVPNLARTIDMLKSLNFWIYGTSVYEEENRKISKLSEAVFNFPVAIILGGEHSGISRLLKDKSDELIKIEMSERLDSLNVSVSAGILLYSINCQAKKSKI